MLSLGLLNRLLYGLELARLGLKLSVWLVLGPGELLHWLLVWLGFGLLFGLTIGLLVSLGAFLQHFALRFWLRCAGSFPWNMVAFLDEADERLLLRKAGGGYLFVHRLLLDYVASLEKGGSKVV